MAKPDEAPPLPADLPAALGLPDAVLGSPPLSLHSTGLCTSLAAEQTRCLLVVKRRVLVNEAQHVPMDEIQIDEKLNFVEKSVEILDREMRKLKRSKFTIVKVRWYSKRGPEYTWKREDHMRKKFPHLFDSASTS